MDGQSLNLSQERIKILKELLPDVFTEGKLDYERLKISLGEDIFVKNEHYELSWAGKNDARHEIQRQTTSTLIPDRSASIDFDQSENIFIEGENLEVLRTLQRSYFGRINMIYIDPPYNTGNDSFVYPDDYVERIDDYQLRAGITDTNGYINKQDLWRVNRRENGQFHSAWLSMIYPRLFLARNLLREDGSIFISIDDNEINNLRTVLDEVFGEENFVVQIIWKRRSTPPNDQIIGANHEYILVYAKNKEQVSLNLKTRSKEQIERYKNPDNHPKGPWVSGDLMANVKGGRYVASLHFPIVNPNTGEEHYPSNNGNWRFNYQKILDLITKDEIHFGDNGKGRPKLKRFLSDVKDGITYPSIWDFVAFNSEGSSEMADLLGNMNIFDNPKPSALIKELIQLGCDENGIILDFFAGSATTAHATIELNAEYGSNRKFILVQMPENTGDKSEAYKAGYYTIADISRERIRQVINNMTLKISNLEAEINLMHGHLLNINTKKVELTKSNPDLFDDSTKLKLTQKLRVEYTSIEERISEKHAHINKLKSASKNFRAFQLSQSNFNVWQAEAVNKSGIGQLLLNYTQSDKPGSDSEKMLYEFLLKKGFSITSKVEVLNLDGIKAYSVENGKMLIMLEGYNQVINNLIIETAPKHVVCLDRLFEGNDEALTNLHLDLRDRGIELSII
jgi:adenine-specific DNA-methyltransferase